MDGQGRPAAPLEEMENRPVQSTRKASKPVNPKMLKLSMSLQPKSEPLDYSWKDMKSLDVILDGKVEATNWKGGQKKPTKKPSNTTLLVGSNAFTTIVSLPRIVNAFFMGPENLLWLDVSHNRLTTIEPILLSFPNLSILYMHGNEITKLKEVNKLVELQHLKKLTLHGNPVEEIMNYRLHVFTQIPQLRMLDFINCTKVDRDKAGTWDALKFKPKY